MTITAARCLFRRFGGGLTRWAIAGTALTLPSQAILAREAPSATNGGARAGLVTTLTLSSAAGRSSRNTQLPRFLAMTTPVQSATKMAKVAPADEGRRAGPLLFMPSAALRTTSFAEPDPFSRRIGSFIVDMVPDKAFSGPDPMARADVVVALHRRF